MKRLLSIFLSLTMLLSICAACFVTTAHAAKVTLSNNSPAIAVNVGTKITLSDYSVTFDNGTVSSNVTWKNGSNEITSFTPSSKGVTKLTATSGSNTKTIYVVAKNTSESEYVLYEANMSDYASTTALTNAGWTFTSGGNYSKNSDGSLSLGVSDKWSIAYAYLPSWLADFGNIGFEANVKVTSVYSGDNTRWFSLLYHGSSRAGTESQYLQMTVRNAANTTNGVEFGERYNAAWNVVTNGGASVALMSSAYNTIKAEYYNGVVSETVAGKQVIYVDAATTKSKIQHQAGKGQLAFTMSGGVLAVKSVKVTLQTAEPEEVVATSLINNNNHGAQNLVNPIANAQKIDSVTANTLSGLSVAYFNASDVNLTNAMKACVDAGVVPTIYVASNSQADSVVAAMNSTGNIDVTVISSSASVLKYIRGKKAMVRTGLRMDISSQLSDGKLTAEEANAIRIKVRSAPATFLVVDSNNLTRDAVAELQEFAVAVWVVASNKSTGTKSAFDTEIIKIITAGVNGIITDSAAAVNTLIETHFVDDSFTRTSLIIGHRGNPSCAPENTIPSFQAAYDNGADVFEIDVDLTKDNVVVVLHDGTLDRTTTYDDGNPDAWGGTHVNNMTWAEVQKYHVLQNENDPNSSTGKPIPTLAEVLEWARGKDVKIFIEFKSAAATCITQTMNKVKELNMAHQVDVISFASSALTQAQNGIPGMSTGYLLSNKINAVTYAKALQQLENLIQYAQNVNSTVNMQSYGGEATRHTIQAATDRGMTVWPWTYNSSTTDIAFFSAADGITTDNVETIKDMVKSVYAENTTLVVGQTYIGGTLTAETYGNKRFFAEPGAIVGSIITGDAVKIENGKLVAVKEGTSTVVLGYRTKTAAGTDYVVYAQPITITVDNGNKNAMKNLFDVANLVSQKQLSENDLNKLREFQFKALDIANGTKTATDAEMIAVTKGIGDILNSQFYELVAIPAVSYTTTAPNYYYNNTNKMCDDGLRLIDGAKSHPDGNSERYSAWGSGVTVEITLDYGKKINSKFFRGYFASGQWGITAPKSMQISYSNDKSNWNTVEGNVEIETVSGSWSTNVYTFVAKEAVNARYIKFTIKPSGNFTWVDEVEVLSQLGDKVQGDYVYLTSIDKPVTSGSATIFTSKSSPITVADENHAWTYNIVAKWDKNLKAYVIKSASQGEGATTPKVTLASDEIMIAVHDWETGVNNYTAVKGSAQNYKNAYGAAVGKIVKVYGFDSERGVLGAAPYVKFEVADSTHEHSYSKDWSSDKSYHWHECECTDKVDLKEHTASAWKTVKKAEVGVEGKKEKRCTVCNYLIAEEIIPALEDSGTTPEPTPIGLRGDVNKNGSIDSRDYVTLKRAYFKTAKLDEVATKLADINNNGSLDSRDYVTLKRVYFKTAVIKDDIKYVY